MRTALLLPLLALATPALAAGPLQVTSRVLAESKRRAPDGSTQIALVPVTRAVPGDRVVFVLSYRNAGRQPLSGIVFDNPVPGGVAYRAAADGSPAPDVSVDGATFAPLAQLRVRTPSGGSRAAAAADVTRVRWRLAQPLAAGAGGEFAFQAVLK